MSCIKTIVLKNIGASAMFGFRGVMRQFVSIQTLKGRSNLEMGFTIPGLNQREEKYIERQVHEVMASNVLVTEVKQEWSENLKKLTMMQKMNNDVLNRRVIGLMETFEVQSEHRDTFLQCLNTPPKYISLGKKSSMSRYVVDHLLAKLRLQYCSLSGGDVSQFLLISNRDQLGGEVNETTFQTNYRTRYLETLSHLELDELAGLVDSLDGTADFQIFCQTFFEKLLWIKSGVSNVDAIRKKITKARGRDIRGVRGRYLLSPLDPINIVRNYFLLDKVLAMDLDIDVKNMSLLGALSSLDVLVTLNVWDRVMWQDLDADRRRQNIIEYLQDFGGEIIQEDTTWWYFPSTMKKKYLLEIGFTKDEIDEILLLSSAHMINQIFSMAEESGLPSKQDSERFIATMKWRLNILRIDGPKLGILSLRQIYQLLFQWDKFIKAVNKSLMYPRGSGVKNVLTSRQLYTPGERSVQGQMESSVHEMLIYYFECDTTQEQADLAHDISKLPYRENVPLRIVIESIKFLEREGFSKLQMREAVQLLFYSHKILKETLRDIRLNNEIQGSDWLREDNALCKLHYFVEKRSGFLFKEVLVKEGLDSKLSEELIGELNTNSDDVVN